MIFGLIILGVLAILALSVWIEPKTETEPMKFEADSGQGTVLILRKYMRSLPRRKTSQNRIVKEVLLTDNMSSQIEPSSPQSYGYAEEKLNLEKVYLTEGAALAAALDIANLISEQSQKSYE